MDIPEGYLLIEDGKAAMWPEYSGSWSWRSQNMNLGVVPFPVSEYNPDSTQAFGDGFNISGGTNKAEAAWRWLIFLTEQEGQDFGIGGPVTLPARQSVAEASGFWDEVDDELEPALRYAVDHAHVSQGYSEEVYDAMNEAFTAVIDEGVPVAEALADAQLIAEQVLAAGEMADEEATPAPEITVAEPEAETTSPDAVTIEYHRWRQPLLVWKHIGSWKISSRRPTPNINVELKQPNFTGGNLDLASIASSVDCLEWFPSFEDPKNVEAILALDAFMDNDPTISEDDFFSVVMEDFTHQGQVVGFAGWRQR